MTQIFTAKQLIAQVNKYKIAHPVVQPKSIVPIKKTVVKSAWDFSKVKPIWNKSSTEIINEIASPVSPVSLLSVGGVFGSTTNIITKTPGLLKGLAIGGAAGVIGGYLFGGGSKQQQAQTQASTQAQGASLDQLLRTMSFLRGTQKTTTITSTTYGNIDTGGGSFQGNPSSVVTPTQELSTSAGQTGSLGQAETSGQAQTATQTSDNTMLLIIAAIIIGAVFLFKKK